MLDLLILESRNNGLKDLDIREEVDTFMLAVSSHISFIFSESHCN